MMLIDLIINMLALSGLQHFPQIFTFARGTELIKTH